MRFLELAKDFQDGKLHKWVYWKLVREKMKPLTEMQEVLAWNDDVARIEIRKDGIVLVHSGGADEREDGIRFYMDFEETISRAEAEFSMKGDYEQEDFDFLRRFLPENAVVLDVGGNVGIFSLSLAQEKKNLQIFAFEPLPSTYAKMQANFRLNPRLAEKVKSYNKGLSKEVGEAVFYLPGASEAASLRPNEDAYYSIESTATGEYTGQQKMQEVRCELDTVDHFCETNAIVSVHVLKCDVEGAEYDVLRGARKTLIESRPIVYSEMLRKHAKRFGYHPNEIISYMKELDYCCTTFRGQKLIEIIQMTDATEERNFFFLHKENHADILRQHLET